MRWIQQLIGIAAVDTLTGQTDWNMGKYLICIHSIQNNKVISLDVLRCCLFFFFFFFDNPRI